MAGVLIIETRLCRASPNALCAGGSGLLSRAFGRFGPLAWGADFQIGGERYSGPIGWRASFRAAEAAAELPLLQNAESESGPAASLSERTAADAPTR